MGVISPSPHLKPQKGDSSPQKTAAGSGPRPKKSKIPTATSAPTDAHTLGRVSKGMEWLK